jgi:double jelly roll domain-containing protein
MTSSIDKRLVYKKVKHFQNSFKKVDYKKIPCSEGEANLNEGGEKTFVFNYGQMLAYFHESMIMEIFEIKDTVDEITLQNDFYPDLYSSGKVKFGTEDIENVSSSVGEASTLMRLVSTTKIYKKTYGALSGWFPDSGEKTDKDNKGFISRKEYYNGKTTVKIFYPLKFLFGIFNDYQKVFYGIPNITLILNRKEDAIKRIFFGSKLKSVTPTGGTAADVNPSYTTKKLEWWIPILTPNLTAEAFFHNQINSEKNIEMASMKHRMAKTTFNVSNYTWTISEVKNHVRYVFIGFKTENDNIKKNNNLFTIKNIRKIQVSVNGEDYPEINFNSDTGDVAELYLAYIKSCEFFGYEPQLNIKEYTSLYPIICNNTTNQPETLVGNSVSVSIEKDGTDQITAYCLLLEESLIVANLGDHSIKKL